MTTHVDQQSTTLNDTIILEGYKVYGICQYAGSLDYIVALETTTNEIRVITLDYDSITLTSTVSNYKKVERDEGTSPVDGEIYVDCTYTDTYMGVNTYVIAIGATIYRDTSQDSNYYLAKFSTKYNLTEYFSEQSQINSQQVGDYAGIMEQAVGVKVDTANQMIYIAVEINKNWYNNKTVYAPGALPAEDNANIAIIAFSWTHGVRMWTTVIGNEQYTDIFAQMDVLGNDVIVLLNSYSTQYSTNSSQTDIYYYRMRSSNGFIEASKIFGSPQTDIALDLQVTFGGAYILALVNDQFFPHMYNDRIWSTQNRDTSLIVIWMDFSDNILDIEGYDINQMVSPYPTKMLVVQTPDHNQTFIFAAQRTNDESDLQGGLHITQFAKSSLLFKQPYSCSTGCKTCSGQLNSQCFECSAGYYMFKQTCYANQCPDFSYPEYDESGAQLRTCGQCHYSCLACTGPSKYQCATCCMNDYCGSLYNRVPTLGQCECSTGLADSNGICLPRCTTNLKGKRQDFCYSACPQNSYPLLQYDQALPQERSQYDSSSTTDCLSSSNHLTFKTTKKGIAVLGPTNLNAVPNEATISFWVRPTQLSTTSYFVNAFNRIYVSAQSSNNNLFFNYKTTPTTSIQPVYSGTVSNRQIVLNSWNYVSVSIRQYLIVNTMKYEMQMAVCNSNMGTVNNAAYDNTQAYVFNAYFYNTIYLGASSDMTPQSFSGILKEFKLFTKYHGFAQMQDERLRLYRYYSYDDSNLVAYWKLNETYTATNIQYTINDYSNNQNSLTYSVISDPDYPVFNYDNTIALSLCIFHDVAICQSLDFEDTTHPMVMSGKRLTQAPTMQLNDLSQTKTDGDQLWFVSNNTLCTSSNMIAYMTYRAGVINNFVIEDLTMNPVDLSEATHYQVCYFMTTFNVSFNLFQVYLMGMPLTVDPSSRNAYITPGAYREWMTVGGDSGYGDVIQFSEDCSYPEYDDFSMVRSNKPDFGKIYMSEFSRSGYYYFCWQHVFVQESNAPYFDSIHNLKFTIVQSPKIDDTSVSSVNVNENIVHYNLEGAAADGDLIAFAWSGTYPADCKPENFLGQTYVMNYSYWPAVWFGMNSGVYGVKNYTMDEIQMCYYSNAESTQSTWMRLKKSTGNLYFLKIYEYNFALNGKVPELQSISPSYGSTELYESDNTITFNFLSQLVYPSRQSDGASPVYGKIQIFRGAIQEDGTLIKTSSTLWSLLTLDDFHTPSPLIQGDLMCTSSGSCTITLNSLANKMKAGEIYYLSFYPKSFAAKPTPTSLTRYYLFNNVVLQAGQTSAYDHLFFCRSFDIVSSTSLINGETLTIYGTDLYSKSILSQENQGGILTATFTTMAINLVLTIMNTVNTFCTSNPPTVTVKMADVQQTSFTVYNLNLRDCNEGDLFADIEVVRGIRDQYGDFTHLRGEFKKNVQLGAIGCDSTCLSCDGITSSDCLICSDSNMFMSSGQCLSTCPSSAPYYTTSDLIYQSGVYSQQYCLQTCPFGMYADLETSNCLNCNPDCQSCNSSLIASCISCNPVKYLYNGMCLFNCPSPHHANNFSDYSCTQISSTVYLQVKIQSLGYKSRIPKNVQSYLKAYIDNDNGGVILTITWEQVEPVPDSALTNIFSEDDDGTYIDNVAVIKLRMAAFNYMSSTQVVKVQCTVVNSIGEIAYDIYEFYLNSPPIAGTSSISLLTNGTMIPINANSTYNGSSPTSLYYFNMSSWTFNGVGLLYKLYFTADQVYYLITDQFQSSSIQFRFPSISKDSSAKNISLCVNAVDEYNAEQSSCFILYNLGNDLSYVQNITVLINYLLNLNFTNNMTNVIQASQMMYFAIEAPMRQPSSPGLCALDAHCNNNGNCDSQIGLQRCVCFTGYSGSFCQYSMHQLATLQQITSQMIATLFYKIITTFEIKSHEIELIGTTLRGVLIDPDVVTDNSFKLCLQLVGMASNASEYAFKTVSVDVRQIYLEALSEVSLKVIHSYKVQRLSSVTVNTYGSETSSTNSSRMLAEGKQYSILDSVNKKQFLIGGKQTYSGHINGRLLQSSAPNSIVYSSLADQYQDWGRTIDKSITTFVKMILLNLNPSTPTFISTTPVFDLYAMSYYADVFKDIEIFIYEKNAYWTIPEGVFDNNQGQASDSQEVRLVLMKYIANPFQFEQNPGAFIESNVTTMSFYNTKNDHIDIILSANSFMEIKQPWNKSQSYALELLRCMYWDEDLFTFVNDDTCSYSLIYDDIPCLTCAENEYINTTIVLCRCVHMSRYAAVYEQTSPNTGSGIAVGIYSDFFAMQYWQQSFGYFAVLACLTLFLAGHLVIYFVDRNLQSKILTKLRERARKMELKGFKQRQRDFVSNAPNSYIQKKIQTLFKKKNQKNPLQKDEEIKFDEELSSPVTKLKHFNEDEGPTLEKAVVGKQLGKKGGKQKMSDSDRSSLLPINGKKPKKNSKKNKKGQDQLAETRKNLVFDEQIDHDDTDKQGLNIENKKKNKDEGELVNGDIKNTEERKEEEEEEHDKEMKKRYEEEQKDSNKNKAADEDEDSDEANNFNKEQLKFFRNEKQYQEQFQYKLKRMIVYGNYATSLLFVTSIISPRHTRWTLLVACICLNWFWCAVIYNNTKSPLVLPDFNRSSYNIDTSDLWVSFVSPFGTIILMYIFAGLFKISDSRLKHSYTSIYLELMLIELKKEMRLRFILAYFITVSIFSAVFWYIIKFTATFGWKTSWLWWYSGIYAILLQFCIIDPIVNTMHWITYNCSRQLALFCMKLRMIKQARNESI